MEADQPLRSLLHQQGLPGCVCRDRVQGGEAVTAVDKYRVISHLRGLQVLSSLTYFMILPPKQETERSHNCTSYYEMSNMSTKEKLHLAPNSAPHWVNHLVCSVWNQQILKIFFLKITIKIHSWLLDSLAICWKAFCFHPIIVQRKKRDAKQICITYMHVDGNKREAWLISETVYMFFI